MELLRASVFSRYKLVLIQSRQMHLLKNKAFVNNNWVSSLNKEEFPVLNPANEKVIVTVPDMNAADVTNAIEIASDAFKSWKKVTAKARSKIIRNWFDLCEQNSDDLAELITLESGKPLAESKSEIVYGNSFIEFFANCSQLVNGHVIPSPWPNKQIIVTREPLGVVSVITPWNFPHAMVTRKVGALLAAGCTCVIKPSEDTPLTALALGALAMEAGVPEGVINVVTSSPKNSPEVGKVLCEDENIRCISFTGSTAIGRILYQQAAKGIKRVSLELGGNAPFIVLPSADIWHTIQQAMLAKFRNTGQACVGANRFLVHADVYDTFVKCFKESIENNIKLGHGCQAGVNCGPLINSKQVQNICKLVEDAVQKGAKILTGGGIAKEIGNNFYKPTLLVDVKPDMTIFHQEIFGPIAQVIKIKCEEEALEIANSSKSGLAGYVFTTDIGQAFRMSKNLQVGMVAINDGILSTAEAPFGGVKESGIGREGSLHGVEEYTDMKYTLFSNLDK